MQGSLGYSAFSQLGVMREDLDVTTTWEGANHVLIQQPAKFVLKGVQKLAKGERIEMRSLAELHQEARWVPPSKLLLSHKLNRLVQKAC